MPWTVEVRQYKNFNSYLKKFPHDKFCSCVLRTFEHNKRLFTLNFCISLGKPCYTCVHLICVVSRFLHLYTLHTHYFFNPRPHLPPCLGTPSSRGVFLYPHPALRQVYSLLVAIFFLNYLCKLRILRGGEISGSVKLRDFQYHWR